VKRLAANPVLLLVGAIVVIDLACQEPITTVLRRNRAEAALGIAWLALHISKAPERTPFL
jgi:hypothetical protein